MSNSYKDRNEIVINNMGLVYKVVNDFKENHHLMSMFTYDDAVQIASIALMTYSTRFDQSLGNTFSTYLYPCMYGSLLREWSKYKDESNLMQVVDVRDLLFVKHVESTVFAKDFRQQLKDMLIGPNSRLTKAQCLCIIMYFGLGWTGDPKSFREIANYLDLSASRVQQILRKGLRVLLKKKEFSRFVTSYEYDIENTFHNRLTQYGEPLISHEEFDMKYPSIKQSSYNIRCRRRYRTQKFLKMEEPYESNNCIL